MKREIELLAPGGNIDSIKAAIAAGADAVYCGLGKFNARGRAENIDIEDLGGIIRLARKNGCKVFLTLNIIIVESEVPDLIRLLNRVVNTQIDGVIVQDLGLFYLLTRHFKGLNIHASTQLNTHNEGQVRFLNRLGAGRINLARELSIDEIRALTSAARENNISTEVFVHGSYCISFSGLCYMSSLHGGRSGNRGRCSQPCRDQYMTTPAGRDFPLNLKDNSAYSNLQDIYDAGVASLKIEGRIKGYDYVYTVVKSWREQISRLYNEVGLDNDKSPLYRVFNRDFSNGYLKGDISRDMFIDNPRDFSIRQLAGGGRPLPEYESGKEKKSFYEEKEKVSYAARERIKRLVIEHPPLTMSVSGKAGAPLKVTVKTPDSSFAVTSKISLAKARNHEGGAKKSKAPGGLEREALYDRFRSLNHTEYRLERLETEGLEEGLFLPISGLNSMKKTIFSLLSGNKKYADPIGTPTLKKAEPLKTGPTLSVVISSTKDLYLCNNTSADIYFQLPASFSNDVAFFTDLFLNNRGLTPWFPPVLIGEEYDAAIKLLEEVRPGLIVTDNTGIAFGAFERGIEWIAGPFFNMVNSFSLLSLKEDLNCSGAFISNEIKEYQIKCIRRPEGFKLYYSIYHPILLMMSRQCFFHQVTGCNRERIEEGCIDECERSASITNLNGAPLIIEKSKGNYNCIYGSSNFLNTEIADDLSGIFSGFFIDLRDITTGTKTGSNKGEIIKLFEDLLDGAPGSKEKLHQAIHPSTSVQYKKGI